jgi:hypothetical protein
MTAAIDERKEIHGSEDFDKLGAMLREYLAGQPVLRVTLSGELVFHLGEPQEYQTARMRKTGLARGSWQLRIMRSPWESRPVTKPGLTISAGVPVLLGEPLSEEMVEEKLKHQFKDAQVTNLKVTATADLAVSFSNGYDLVLWSRYAEKDPTKPLWKLSTPYKMAIHVFGEPASCWSYLRSDIPLREA